MTEPQFTDYDRMLITQKGYKDNTWHVGTRSQPNDITIKGTHKDQYIGTVVKVVHDSLSGLDAVVLKDPKTKTIRVIYQGSRGIGNDWIRNNIPEALSAMGVSPLKAKEQGLPISNQFRASSRLLKQVLSDYPDCHCEVYGHSLGSMVGQYALSDLTDKEAARIKGAWLYQGPNIYNTLDVNQQKRASSYSGRLHNYVDTKDLVAFGYTVAFHSILRPSYGMNPLHPDPVGTLSSPEKTPHVGDLYRVDSLQTDNIKDQHMWGGYQFSKKGMLALYRNNIINRQASLLKDLSHAAGPAAGSASGEIFADVEQARIITHSATQIAEGLIAVLPKHGEKIVQSLEEEWDKAVDYVMNSSIGNGLSRDKVEQVLADAGLSKKELSDNLQTTIAEDVARVRRITDSIGQTGDSAMKGMATLLEQDKHLAHKITAFENKHLFQ
ncbi:Uncharacterised protein [Scardovia inopinata]|uniref:Fungal lipase-like domain-containing protein n=1 Tax=Scardovia inopinata F0304 TaxID=641146 RepID=W5IIX9_SCAIO|nr:DUF2974 domain-containing protein [Scardovia inopinata]EFG26990.1 hypothetical protein HMPREF9020_00621 [Scardovia inopinata F0304]BAR06600.1 conserved hypothetical protein [Scardovia inopinata JCM 12537]SUV52118.1 Uncharacterised protein [Scardovia inopinata]